MIKKSKKKLKKIVKSKNVNNPDVVVDRLNNKNSGKRGRPKGIQNKVTIELKEAFKQLIDYNVPKFKIWLDRIAETNPEKALRLLIEMTPFVIPKLASQNLTVKEQIPELDYSKLTDEELDNLLKLTEKCKNVKSIES